MKKFDRLPPELRREEIKAAARKLFCTKGFSATTMENIVSAVSLSKGGVYRIYPSATAILEDLILDGMHGRNGFYEQQAAAQIARGEPLTAAFLGRLMADSLWLDPETAGIYVEFLWEKQRNPQLQALYHQICTRTVEETLALIRRFGAEELICPDRKNLERLANGMNAAILSIRVLGPGAIGDRERLAELFTGFLAGNSQKNEKGE